MTRPSHPLPASQLIVLARLAEDPADAMKRLSVDYVHKPRTRAPPGQRSAMPSASPAPRSMRDSAALGVRHQRIPERIRPLTRSPAPRQPSPVGTDRESDIPCACNREGFREGHPSRSTSWRALVRDASPRPTAARADRRHHRCGSWSPIHLSCRPALRRSCWRCSGTPDAAATMMTNQTRGSCR